MICKKCGYEASEGCIVCPQCLAKLRKRAVWPWWLLAGAAVLAALAALAAGGYFLFV